MMNSKSEYNGARIPRIRMEVGDRVLTRDYVGTGVPDTMMEEQEERVERAQEQQVLEWERTRNERRLQAMKDRNSKAGGGQEDKHPTRPNQEGGQGQEEDQ